MAASGLLLPPASSPRLGRSSAAGRAAPRPPGLRPLCALRRTGPCCGRSATGWVGAPGGGQLCCPRAGVTPCFPPFRGKSLNVRQAKRDRPEADSLWASGVGAVGLWAALLSTNPRQPPTCPSGRSGMTLMHRQARRRRSALCRQ